MNKGSSRLFALVLMCHMAGAIAAPANNGLTEQHLAVPRGEIIVGKRLFEKQVNPDILCTGTVVQDLPAIGKCPDIPGYVEIGFPICTQKFSIPKKQTFKEISPGFVRLVCELDYANATALEAPVCDYSRCQYIEEPTFP